MKELVEAIARALVDHPEDVQVTVVEGEQGAVLELRVHAEDLASHRSPGPHRQSHSHPTQCKRYETP